MQKHVNIVEVQHGDGNEHSEMNILRDSPSPVFRIAVSDIVKILYPNNAEPFLW